MIEIPSDLHPDLVPLAFLLGNWAGAGVSDFPGAEKCNFGQEVTFSHDGRDFLEYVSHSWVLDSEGNQVEPLESESGYWRIDKDRKVEIVMVRDQGIVEVWYGELAKQKPQIDIVTDAVARTAASGPVGEKATPDVELRPYMSAHLKKVVTPEEVAAMAKSLGDMPDDGIAFFK
ncbi:FABP family protein [Streptomyces sp. NRRL S-15]|uniref:FABP family protein n=1 Tax=Streptomyces sp. NRRL S-15 TaxID=1463886 RepID=UPI0004C4EDA1|nr:FABP family protein [Streptomyces sp. NRRL S-15]